LRHGFGCPFPNSPWPLLDELSRLCPNNRLARFLLHDRMEVSAEP
jgi:hypothetical protein